MISLRVGGAPSSVVALQSWVKSSSPSLRGARRSACRIVEHEGAAGDAARHLRARDGLADDGDCSCDHIDEGGLHTLYIGAHVRAQKRPAARSSVDCLIAG